MHTVFALLAQRKIKHATVLRVCVNLGHAEGTVEPNEVIFRDMRVLHAKLPVVLPWPWLRSYCFGCILLLRMLFLAAHDKSLSVAIAFEMSNLLHEPLQKEAVGVFVSELFVVVVLAIYQAREVAYQQTGRHVCGQSEGILRNESLHRRRECLANPPDYVCVLSGHLEESELCLPRLEVTQTDGLVQEVMRFFGRVAEREVVHCIGDVQISLKVVIIFVAISDLLLSNVHFCFYSFA